MDIVYLLIHRIYSDSSSSREIPASNRRAYSKFHQSGAADGSCFFFATRVKSAPAHSVPQTISFGTEFTLSYIVNSYWQPSISFRILMLFWTFYLLQVFKRMHSWALITLVIKLYKRYWKHFWIVCITWVNFWSSR